MSVVDCDFSFSVASAGSFENSLALVCIVVGMGTVL